MEDLTRTQFIQILPEELEEASTVKDIMSGDPTYITSHKNARALIMKVERDELVEEMLKAYIRNSGWNN